MATAKKLPSGQWRTLAYSHTETVDGKQKRIYESFTAPTKKEAEYMAAEFMLNKKRLHIGNLTFIEAAENYIADKENILSPSTIRGYKYIIKKETEDINKIPIKKIDEKLLQRFINNNSIKYSSKSISNQIGFISAVLKKYKIVQVSAYNTEYLENTESIHRRYTHEHVDRGSGTAGRTAEGTSAEGTGQLHSLDSGKIRKNTGKEEKSSDNLSGRRI